MTLKIFIIRHIKEVTRQVQMDKTVFTTQGKCKWSQ